MDWLSAVRLTIRPAPACAWVSAFSWFPQAHSATANKTSSAPSRAYFICFIDITLLSYARPVSAPAMQKMPNTAMSVITMVAPTGVPSKMAAIIPASAQKTDTAPAHSVTP